ncbi:uncharacterized protein [Euwallacea fornicatus]|uniref:uncharacterized protein n=1 Tax=Euwallacea fornicatus TaxID=995702 RepID=UPI00338FB24B
MYHVQFLPIIVLFAFLTGHNVKSSESIRLFRKSLSSLPLADLIILKRNLWDVKPDYAEHHRKRDSDPQALPLRMLTETKKGLGTYYPYPLQENDEQPEKGKITKIFQSSVTTLSFLAFGGYLLFLVVAAVKATNPNIVVDPTATQIMQAMINTGLHKRKKKGKRKKKKKKKKRRQPFTDGIHHSDGLHYEGRGTLDEDIQEKLFMERQMPHMKVTVDSYYDVLSELCAGYAKFTDYR